MKTKRIQVSSSSGPYAVVCGAGILRGALREIEKLGKFSATHLVSSPRVWKAVGRSVEKGLPRKVIRRMHWMDDSEASKNVSTFQKVSRSLVRAGADRKSLLIAVGGGVIGDVAGFVASVFLRGVALVQVPTTLIAQVDSALGGKTGVNLPEGKNLLGTFYPARLVLADSNVLSTLPARQYRGGLAEVIKYGIIGDAQLFAFLEKNFDDVLNRDRKALSYLIPRSVEIKASVVSKDERESSLREILNFGHTFGHALESITNYRRYQHGEAVAWGMMAAALLGHEVGATAPEQASRIVALVRRLGPLPAWPDVPPNNLIAAMYSDKKARGGKLRFVLAPRIGKAASYDGVPVDAVKRVLRFMPRLLLDSGKLHG
jgi:3-dehydroquinate synthase